jgi:vacuolar-type H+-ATPase subunit F/Vma7
MQIRVIGDARDVTGFGLAGVAGTECRTREEIVAALDDIGHDPSVAIVLISPQAAALGLDVIARLRDSVRLPIAVVLPSDQEDTMHGKHAA